MLFHAACVLAGCAVAIVMALTNSPRQINMVEDAINWNQLQFFLGCNLMTGMFNLIMRTHYQSVLMFHLVMLDYFCWEVILCCFFKKIGYCQHLIPN